MLSPEEIRLECLKLAHAHGRMPEEVTGRAEVYEKFVVGPEPKGDKTLRLPGKAGNSAK